MNETYDIELVPLNSYIFELPGTPEGEEMEVLVTFFRDIKHNIIAEAWLRPKKCRLKQFWADIYKFEDYDNLSDEEVINKVLPVFNESEVFNNSVQAILENDWEYFEIGENSEEVSE